MLTYRYNGTAEGLFTAFELAMRRGEESAEFVDGSGSTSDSLFFDSEIRVRAEPELAEAFGCRLGNAAPGLPGEFIRAFLSELPEIETVMYRYAGLALRFGGGVRANLADEVVARFQHAVRRVSRETHRFKGLLRFEELEDGLLWANFEPGCNISTLLVPHFSARLTNHRWVICDVGRGTAIYYDGNEACPAELEQSVLHSLRVDGRLPQTGTRGDPYADVWRQYFAVTAIGERANPKLQRQFMPKRFWKWLPEKRSV